MTRITDPKQSGRLIGWFSDLFQKVEQAQPWQDTEISEPEVTEVDAAEFFKAQEAA